jgi:lipoate-protein ligase A
VTNSGDRSGEGGWGAARADLISWRIERLGGPAAVLVQRGIPDRPERLVRWCEPERPAVVWGSAQREAPNPWGWEVVRRRTGGAAVYVAPGRLVWADVVLPRGDPLWSDDVGVAAEWLGDVWSQCLGDVGVSGTTVHRGAMVKGRWSSLVCFAGVAAGEVVIGGRKVVGISQRRTKHAALFQCAALLYWDPPDPELAHVAIGMADALGRPVDPARVEATFVARLPRS